jgi:hypothetical protein
MDWAGVAGGLAFSTTWGLARCTLFAREHERKRIDYLLQNFEHKDGIAKISAEVVVREYRLRVIPLWLIAAAISWAWLIYLLRA